jgi:hypothetical protein
MIREVLEDTDKRLEDVVRRLLVEEIPEATEAEIRETLGHIQFLDYYIRFYVRAEVVRTLVDNGIKVYAFGGGWENFECNKPENFLFETEEGKIITLKEAGKRRGTQSRYLTSLECLERIRQAKISLNVMPWFKDGAHDRIYNSMLNGAVSLTDDSIYLRETLRDGENVCFYDLKNLDKLPQMVTQLLSDEAGMTELARNAYDYAVKEHTWAKFACQLMRQL